MQGATERHRYPLFIFQVFPLMAGEVSGQSSLLHGFTKDILAEAFNTDEDLVEQLQTKTPDRCECELEEDK